MLHSNELQRDQRQPARCIQCSQSHTLTECQAFKSYSVNDRWALVKRHQLCFGCLVSGHSLSTCQRKASCGIDGCQRKHHRLLHSSTGSPVNQVEHVFNCRLESQTTLFKVLPVTLFGPRGKIEVYAMFDEGSSISLLNDSVATSLGLQGQTSLLSLQWYGKNKSTEKSRRVTVDLQGQGTNRTFAIKTYEPYVI